MPIPNYDVVRMLAGALFLLDVLFYLPWANTCLGEGYWGKTFPHRREVLPAFLLVWAAAAAALAVGFYPLVALAVLWVIFRKVYISNRWKNPFRGGGAPGFMSHYLVQFLGLFELTRWLDPTLALTKDAHAVFCIDFGVVLLCSGTYKSLSGYLRGEGMEYGIANPMWGYWHWLFRRIPPGHIFLRFQDIFAAVTQVTMGALLIIPSTRAIGAALCLFGFAGLLFMVRLGRLAVLMMAVPALAVPDQGLAHLVPTALVRELPAIHPPAIVLSIVSGAMVAYLVLLPLVKGMQYLNLFAKVTLPGPIQRALTAYANLVPIIMWRVFTPDVTNFFIRMYRVDEAGARTAIVDEATAYSYRRFFAHPAWSIRFLHVTESIAITTVFTLLKYFRSQRGLFEERLVAYARSLGLGPATLLFEYVAIVKGDRAFEYLPVTEFLVDTTSGTVTETRIVEGFEYDAPAKHSHIKETVGYGTYQPKT